MMHYEQGDSFAESVPRRSGYKTCDACGEISARVVPSFKLLRTLCIECKAELEDGVIPEVISGRVPAQSRGRVPAEGAIEHLCDMAV